MMRTFTPPNSESIEPSARCRKSQLLWPADRGGCRECRYFIRDRVARDDVAGRLHRRARRHDGLGPRARAGRPAAEVRDATGAILAGRRWHDVAMERYSGRAGIYGGSGTGRCSCSCTSRPAIRRTPASGSCPARSRPSPPRATPPGAAGWGLRRRSRPPAAGRRPARQVVVHIVPVLLGAGVRLYGDCAPTVTLERTGATVSPQLTDLRFRVAR
jgi:hypothetical protein